MHNQGLYLDENNSRHIVKNDDDTYTLTQYSTDGSEPTQITLDRKEFDSISLFISAREAE